MKALRHRIGRWLLRDAACAHHVTVAADAGAAEAIQRALLDLKRRNGGKGLGLA